MKESDKERGKGRQKGGEEETKTTNKLTNRMAMIGTGRKKEIYRSRQADGCIGIQAESQAIWHASRQTERMVD